jgi:hypothetical protein
MAANPDIMKQHDALLDTISQLGGQLDSDTDPADAKKIVLEMQQLTSRVNLLQSLFLVGESAAITAKTKKVTAAKATLDAAIKEDASSASIINGVSSLLSAVDETIQVAKQAMV